MSMNSKRDGHERAWWFTRYPGGKDNRVGNRVDRARRKRVAERQVREEQR